MKCCASSQKNLPANSRRRALVAILVTLTGPVNVSLSAADLIVTNDLVLEKGATLDAAKASGLMESMERYHAEYAPPPEVVASYVDMRNRAATLGVETLPKQEGGFFRPSSIAGGSRVSIS